MKQFAPLFRRQTPGVERFRFVHVGLRASLSTLERKQGMLRAILLTASTIWQRKVALSIAMSYVAPKVGQIIPWGDRRWLIRVYLGRDRAQITLNEYLDRWRETAVKPRVREKTYPDYESHAAPIHPAEPVGKATGRLSIMPFGHDQVVRDRPDRLQQFQDVGSLWFRNHAVPQRGRIMFASRYSACLKSRPPRAYRSRYTWMGEDSGA